jgi:NADH-quinone oxidoreductase subunit N
MSAAPFHMWTPDVYEGAPTPTTGFMAAGVKIAAIAGFLRLFIADFSTHRLVNLPYGWVVVLWLIAVLTMTIGNFAAVRQSNVKRLLAYSSVAHVGYLLVGLIAAAHLYGDANQSRPVTAENLEWSLTAGDTAIASVLYYVLAYALATMGAFACVAWFGADKLEGSQTHEWAGLAQRHPGMALGLTVCLLALMGMPPTAGFFGKLFVFRAAFEDGNPWVRWLIVIALLNSVVGAYYYLRLIVAMYFREPPARDIGNLPGGGAKVVVAVAAIGSLVMGLFADAFLRPAELAGSGMRLRGQARAAQVERLRTRWKAADADGADAEKVGEDAGADQEGAEAAAQAENEADGQAQDRAPDGGADDGADDGAEG